MLTYNERIELREKLINGEISLELAKEQYWKDYKEGQRSWFICIALINTAGILPIIYILMHRKKSETEKTTV